LLVGSAESQEIEMKSKSLKSFLRTTLFTIAAVAVMSNPASSADPIAGAALGAGVGAVAGHSISGRDGALVGGALGAVAGYHIAKKHHGKHRHRHVRHYSPRPVHYYHRPARAYYAPRVYHAPRPVYYAARPVVHRSVHRHVHYYRDRHGRLIRVTTWR
jgi:uncharacterized protein YcfJ